MARKLHPGDVMSWSSHGVKVNRKVVKELTHATTIKSQKRSPKLDQGSSGERHLPS